MTSLSWVDDITKYIQIYQNDDVVRLCWVGIMCVQKHTNNHSIIYNRPILIGIILAIIKMHDSLHKNPLSPPSRMLANKHVLYLYFQCYIPVIFFMLSCYGAQWEWLIYKSSKLEYINRYASPGEVCKNCSAGDTSMHICPYVLWTVLIILR